MIVLVAILIVFLAVRWWTPMTWQTSSSGKQYYVKRAPGQELVADRLDFLTASLQNLLDKADDVYPGDPRISNVRARWNGRLAEVSSSGEVAYSLNKRDIHVCIRGPAGYIEPENTSMYVLLHEIAHVATDDYGHTPRFWLNFRWFLEVAEQLGLYEYEDFDAKQTTFCGHVLGNNVMRCLKTSPQKCKSLLVKK